MPVETTRQQNAADHCTPVGVILSEHEQGREYVKGMVKGIEEYEAGNQAAIQHIHHNMLLPAIAPQSIPIRLPHPSP